MNPIELLQLAAKSIGMKIRIYDGIVRDSEASFVCVGENGFQWNPLLYRNDALSLAEALGMEIFCTDKFVKMPYDQVQGDPIAFWGDDNECKDICEAITCVAADCGRAKDAR